MRSRVHVGAAFAGMALLVLSPPVSAQPGSTQPVSTQPGAPRAPTSPQAEDRSGDAPSAATAEQREEVRVRFARGVQLYAEGEFKLALIEFERAYATAPTYRMLYNIGQVQQQLGHFSKALSALERYVAEGGARIPSPRRTEVERDIATLRTRTAMLIVTVNEAGAEVTFDDAPFATGPMATASRVDAGEHRVRVTKPGFVTETRALVLAGGDDAAVDVTLRAEPIRVELPLAGRSASSGETTAPGRSAMWIAWTTTGVLAAGTAVLGGLAMSNASELSSLRTTVGSDAQAAADARNAAGSRAQAFGTAADVVGVATLVSGIAALYLTLKKPSVGNAGASGPAARKSGGVQIGILGPRIDVVGQF